MVKYTQESLEHAIALVRGNRITKKGASAAFGIPWSTFRDKLSGRRSLKYEPQTILPVKDEKKLAAWLQELCKRGFGYTRKDLQDLVKTILDKQGRVTLFKNNRPGKGWIKAFFKRHPYLSERKAQALGKERAVVTREALQAWYDDMKEYVDKQDPTLLASPNRIFNADESGFSLCPKTKKVISLSGTKHVYSLTSPSRQQVTMLACISATGQYLPPCLIFPYKRDPPFNALEGFEEAYFTKSDNGWINEGIFLSFLRDIFIPHVEKEQIKKPVILYVDGHTSHKSLEVSEMCSQNGIILYCLKAHASHLIQPLDQAVFSPMKAAWQEAVRKHINKTTEAVTLRTFARVLKDAWVSTTKPATAISGFISSGLFPYNPLKVLESDKLKPSETFKIQSSAVEAKAVNKDRLTQLKELLSLSITLGKERVDTYIKRLENKFDIKTDSAYIKWSSIASMIVLNFLNKNINCDLYSD